MDKLTTVLLIIWTVLAVAAFVCSFFCPIVPMIIGIAFGVLNCIAIGGIALQYFKVKNEQKVR